MAKADLTAQRLRELLDYDPASGSFIWRPQPAGHLHSDSGYVAITVDGVEVKAHHLAWFLEYGRWPVGSIDHINGIKHDNRVANLREATSQMNAENRRHASRANKAKLLGATWHAARAKWQAEITVSGKKRYLGIFDTPEEAHAAYVAAKRTLHQGCTI